MVQLSNIGQHSAQMGRRKGALWGGSAGKETGARQVLGGGKNESVRSNAVNMSCMQPAQGHVDS